MSNRPPPAQAAQNVPPALSPDDQATVVFYEVIYHLTEALFGISVVGALFTIITFTIFPRIRTYPIKLIIYLCITICIGHTVFSFAPYVTDSPACVVVGAVVHYFLLSNFFWCGCIAFNFYQMIVKRNAGTRKLEKYYHLVGWGVPCIAVIIVGSLQQYGLTAVTNGACYIRSSILIFCCFFLPGFILVCINSVLFFFVASEIHGTLSKAPEAEQRESSKEFRVLMSIFVTVGLSWLFAFLYAILAQVNVVDVIMLVLMTLITPLQGFFIFVAYCLNKKVRHKWQRLFARCMPFCAPEGGTTRTGATGTTSTRGGGYTSSTGRGGASQTQSMDDRGGGGGGERSYSSMSSRR